MKTFLLATAALSGFVALSAPASANDIVRELISNGLVAAADKVGEIYVNGQDVHGVTQNANATGKLGTMTKYFDPNENTWVFGSVTAANIGNSISIEDITPAPKTYNNVVTTASEGTVTFDNGTTAPVTGSVVGNAALSGSTKIYSFPVPGSSIHGSAATNGLGVVGSADLSGVTGSWSGTETVTTKVREFAKGDVYVNLQNAHDMTQNANVTNFATASSYLENVSLTAANIANSVSITDRSSQFYGEGGDVYLTGQMASNLTQNATANVNLASMTGGAITAANIANSISITDKCGVCK